MSMNILRIALAAAFCLVTVSGGAQKSKKPSEPPGDLFFTRKGQPFALEQLVPGIQGALLLTDEQKPKLMEALETTTRSEPVRAAGRLLKEAPEATEGQKEEARRLIRSARTRLQEMVAGALTPEQKDLVARIDTAVQEAYATARKDLEIEFTETKRDKSRLEDLNRQMRERALAELHRLLGSILNPEQREGWEQAARKQKEAERAAPKKAR